MFYEVVFPSGDPTLAAVAMRLNFIRRKLMLVVKVATAKRAYCMGARCMDMVVEGLLINDQPLASFTPLIAMERAETTMF